jgi:hypothetical protein
LNAGAEDLGDEDELLIDQVVEEEALEHMDESRAAIIGHGDYVESSADLDPTDHLTRAFFPLPCIFPKFPLIPVQIDPDCEFYDNKLRYVTPHDAHMHNTRRNRRFNGSSTGMYWASTAIGRPISVSN